MRVEAKPGKIIIPGRPQKVDLSRVHGDVGSSIRFELTGKEAYLDELPESDILKDTIGRGGRVFITENDDYLFVEPRRRAPRKR